MRLVTELNYGQVIHCPTLEEAEIICRLMDEAGLSWATGDSYIDNNRWSTYEAETCYHVADDRYGDIDYYNRVSFEIIPASDFIKRPYTPKGGDMIRIDSIGDWNIVADILTQHGYRWASGASLHEYNYVSEGPHIIDIFNSRVWRNSLYEDPNIISVQDIVLGTIYPSSFVDPYKITPYNRLLSRSFEQRLREIYSLSGNNVIRKLLSKVEIPVGITKIRNITVTNEGRITFCPAGKWAELNEEGKWSKKYRQEGKIGKVLRKILEGEDFSDSEIEQSVYTVQGAMKPGDFKVVEGEEIRHWYHEDNYSSARRTGTLQDSCMRYNRCQPYFDIYTENPHKIKMLICVVDDKLIGRALLWQTDTIKFMDRIYGTEGTIEAFKEWAVTNGYCYKSSQTYGWEGWVDTDGKYHEEHLTVSDIDIDFDWEFPYLDTFRFMYNNRLETRSGAGYIGELTDTDGGYDGGDRVWDDVTGEWIDEDDAVDLENGEVTHYNNAVRTYRDEYILVEDSVNLVNGQYAADDDPNIIRTVDGWELEYRAFLCEHSGNWYSRNLADPIEIPELNMTVHPDYEFDAYKGRGYILIDGEWVREEVEA